jgi:hypothetical protein
MSAFDPLQAFGVKLHYGKGEAVVMLWIVMLLSASVVFVLRRCPDTQLARALHKHLVALPVARVRTVSRTDLIYFLILAALFTAGSEIVAIAGPEFASCTRQIWHSTSIF